MIGLLPAIGSTLLGNALASDRQNDAQAFSAEQFATRYQTTVKDLEAAGLSPMLAYGQGPGSSPTSGIAGADSSMSQAIQSNSQSKLNSAQIANVEADTDNKRASADLIAAQAAQAWSSASQSNAQTNLIGETVNKVKQEITNLQTDNEKARALIDNIRVEYQNLVKQGYNLTETGNQIRATIAKLQAELPLINSQTFQSAMQGQLSALDLSAAQKFENFGREAAQVGPLVEILKALIRK